MFKKFVGFLFSFVGILFLLLYLTKPKRLETTKFKIKEKEPKVRQTKNVESLIKGSRKVLNERQEEILKLFRKRSVLLPSDIYAIDPSLSTRTFRRDMSHLVSLGMVIQEGSTKDTRYLLKK